MRIGIDVSQAIYGSGVSDYTIELIKNLPPKNIVPVGFSFRRQADISKLIQGARTFPIPPKVLDIIWNKFHLLKFENFSGPIDIYHASDWAQAPTNAKIVTTIHDLIPFLYPHETTSTIISAHTKRMKWAIKECSHFLVVSQNSKNDLQKLFSIPDSKITVTLEAIPERFLLKPAILESVPYICAMGSRQPRKNIDRLIKSFNNFKQKYKLPPKLVIIGETDYSPIQSDIVFTGYISNQEVVNTIANAKAFVYPSIYEGFGLPVLLGFYLKTPVVASNTSSIPEVSGDGAILIDPYSEESIAKGIVQAIEDKKSLTSKGTKQLQKFSWATTADLTLSVYKSIC